MSRHRSATSDCITGNTHHSGLLEIGMTSQPSDTARKSPTDVALAADGKLRIAKMRKRLSVTGVERWDIYVSSSTKDQVRAFAKQSRMNISAAVEALLLMGMEAYQASLLENEKTNVVTLNPPKVELQLSDSDLVPEKTSGLTPDTGALQVHPLKQHESLASLFSERVQIARSKSNTQSVQSSR